MPFLFNKASKAHFESFGNKKKKRGYLFSFLWRARQDSAPPSPLLILFWALALSRAVTKSRELRSATRLFFCICFFASLETSLY